MIKIDFNSSIPIYQQIQNSIIISIQNKELQVNDKLPSLNDIKNEFGLAKETVVMAFSRLKEKGIITSVPGKGFFVSSDNFNLKHNIFLVFDNLKAYKESLYESIIEHLGDHGKVDIFFHHYNLEMLEYLINMSAGKYTEYIIMPFSNLNFVPGIDKLPQDKVYILDLNGHHLGKLYSSVCQDFKNDVYQGLKTGLERLRKYKKLNLVYRSVTGPPNELLKGFKLFCRDYNFEHQMYDGVANTPVEPNQMYFLVNDEEIDKFIEKAWSKNFELGKNIGFISHNESPLKKIAAGGITTISTDFALMGETIIKMVLNNEKKHIINPSKLNLRPSL